MNELALIEAKQAGGHSVFSPSGAETWMTCPASLRLGLAVPDTSNIYAAEGTVAHEIAELWLKTGYPPTERVGEIVIQDGFEVEVTSEMLDYVEIFVDLCNDLARVCEHWASEQRVDTSHLMPIPGQGGTADFVAFKPGLLRIADLKYGKDPVVAVGNKQLRIYALGVFQEWDWLYDFQTIEIWICQPRLAGGTTTATYTREQLLDFGEEVRQAAAIAWETSDGGSRVASEKGCRWCKVKATCPAELALTQALVDSTFEEYDEHGNLAFSSTDLVAAANTEPSFQLSDPHEVSTAQLARVYKYRKHVENYFKAVGEVLLARATGEDEEIPGYKLVESRSRRRFLSDTLEVEVGLLGLGLSPDDFYDRKLVSPAEIERRLHRETGVSLREAKRLFAAAGLTVSPPGKKTLALATDHRDAVASDGDVFDSYEDD